MQDMATMQQHSITSPAPAATIQGSSADSLASSNCSTEVHHETSRTDSESYTAKTEETHNEDTTNVSSRLNSSTEGEVRVECFSDDDRYSCPICETIMSSQHDLTLHIRSHNNDGDTQLSPLTCVKAYTCKICSKVLSSSSSLDRHVLVHSGERPFKCRICGVAFTTNGNMHRHMRTHNHSAKNDQSSYESDGSTDSGGSCKRSPQVSPASSAKKRRVGPHVSSPSSSDSPPSSSSGELGPKRTGDLNDSPPSSSSGEIGLKRTGGLNSSPPSSSSGEISLKRKASDFLTGGHNDSPPSSIQSLSSNESGQKRKASEFLPESAERRRIRSSTVDDHIQATFVQTFRCPVCNKDDFTSVHGLEAHCQDSHPSYQLRCQVCETVFTNHAALNRHLYKVHHKGSKSTKKNNSTVFGFDDLTKWEFSSKKFPHIARIVCEQNVHKASSDIHFECNICERAFPCDSALRIHQKKYHGHADSGDDMTESHSDSDGPTDLSCPRKRPSISETVCESEEEIEERKRESFFAVLDLQNKSSPSSPPSSERREDFTDDSMYFSPGNRRPTDGTKDLADIQSIISVTSAGGLIQDLSKSPPQNGSDDVGLRVMDSGVGEEEQQDCFAAEFRRMKLKGEFPCRLCTAIFPNLRALKGHNRQHLCVGVGPFRCNMCPYSNPDKSTLVRHMRTHNGDRPYECKICKYAFTTKANCERHLRNRHSKLSREDVKNSIIYHPSEDPTNDPDFSGKLQLALQSREDVKRSLVFGSHSPSIEEVSKSEHYHYSLDENTKDACIEREPVKAVETETYNSVSSETQTSNSPHVFRSQQRVVKQVRPWETQEAATMTNITSEDEGSQTEPLVNFAKGGNSYKDQRLDVPYSSPPRETNSPLDLTVDVLDLSTKKEATKESDEDDDEPEEPQDLSNKSAAAKPEYNNNTRFATTAASFMPKTECFPKSSISTGPLFNRVAAMSPHPQSPSTTPIPKLDINTAGFYSSPLNHLYNINNNGFPFSQSQTTFPIHPYVMYPHTLFSNTNVDEIRTRLQKELINNLQLSGGTLLDPMVIASATDRLQAFQQQAFEEFSRRKAEVKLPFTDAKVEDGRKSVSLPVKDVAEKPPPVSSPVIKVTPTAATKPARDRDNSSVKMVIKNGVLMPKQKQRRYRTERPFACEHCSARFTLRSNMERHIKQQHPQFWTQRQRNNIGNTGPGRRSHVAPPSLTVPSPRKTSEESDSAEVAPLPTIINIPEPPKDFHISNLIRSNFSDQVPKTKDELANSALLAESLKAKDNPSIITVNNNNYSKSYISDEVKLAIAQQLKSKLTQPVVEDDVEEKEVASRDDDESELVIDEEKDAEEEKQSKDAIEVTGSNGGGKDVDLASVSRLLDNATTQTKAFQHYFRGTHDGEDGLEGSEEDEEGLVAGSNSEGNNSGSDENRSECELGSGGTKSGGGEKKKSAYSLAPNRVACPYCFRKFPWSSSLRRHVLTHTGQKPYKCPHCPLLFTTKSNCDRHLLRKHGGQTNSSTCQGTSAANTSSSSETSPGSNPTNYTMRNVPERPYKCNYCPSSTFSTQSNLKKHVQTKHSPGALMSTPRSVEDGTVSCASSQHGGEDAHEDVVDDKVNLEQEMETSKELDKVDRSPYKMPTATPNIDVLKCALNSVPEPVLLATKQMPVPVPALSEPTPTGNNSSSTSSSSADLPFKCHLCEGSYAERQEALNHIRDSHPSEYELLMSKGALDSATASSEDNNMGHADDGGTTAGEESLEVLRGKFPDYANRKVMCAFCMRRFWSAEDLRRHMRTHTGERPFSCDICRRRFTLKHSMLRHRKKHVNDSTGYNSTTTCPEDISVTSGDEEHATKPPVDDVPGASSDKDNEVVKPVKISIKMTNHNNNNITAASTKVVNSWDAESQDLATSTAAKILSSKFSSIAIRKNDNDEETDLIGKLLGIQDSVIDKVLQTKSADDAAKLLGVQNGGNQE